MSNDSLPFDHGQGRDPTHAAMPSPQTAGAVVPVLVPMPAEQAYSYAVSEHISVQPGSIVQVPLGPRKVAGVVWDGTAGAIDPKKLRPIEKCFDCPPLSSTMRRFIDWVAHYTMSPPGLVARMALRAPAGFDPEPCIEGLRLTGKEPARLTEPRRRVLELARELPSWTRSGLAHAAGVSAGVINGLTAQGVFEPVGIAPQPIVPLPDPAFGKPDFSGEQETAANGLSALVRSARYQVTLIDGVTGSGKTEVYFEAVAEALRQDRQVLILLPEIALTSQFITRFEDRFGARPAEWHSDTPPRSRAKIWRQAALGQIRVVVGARSALFLPFRDLGLMVVDEEHDPAYKQEDRVFYHARDMAIVRARLENSPIVLASATPSIESRVNADQGRYSRITLEGRYGEAVLPDLSLIDMRREPPARGGFLSPRLIKAVGDTIERGEQALLFLNRRGYAPLTLCRVCGHRFQCPDCSSWLVEHRLRAMLQCHHCGHSEPTPQSCPSCGTFDHLVACGPGVERIAEEAEKHFPDARIIVLSSDVLSGVKQLRLELQAIADGQANIVIGTQLVAKGHNFPLMTLVGVVDADLGLSNGDPRAAERTFQLLSQVTGRAGRFGHKSEGLIQTYQPDHPVMQAIVSGDREAFYAREIIERERAMLPPFGRLAALVISAASRSEAENHARAIKAAALRLGARAGPIVMHGPAEAPLAIIRARYRFRLLVHAPRNASIQAYLGEILKTTPKPRGSVRVQIDIDPQSFL